MRTDSNGNPDICRVNYTPVSEDIRVMATAVKLTLNQVLADLAKLSHLNPEPEAKRLLAIAITDLEKGAVMAVKALFTENFVYERPQQSGGQAAAPARQQSDGGHTL